MQELYTAVGLIKRNGTLAEANTYDGYGEVDQWGYRDFDFDRDGDVDSGDQNVMNALVTANGVPTSDPMGDGWPG